MVTDRSVWSAVLMAAAVATVVWPALPVVRRGRPGRWRRIRPGPGWRWWSTGLALICGLPAGVLGGPPCGLAAALLILTVGRLVRRAIAGRARRQDLGDLASGLHLLARELRSGAPPHAACRAAAESAAGVAVPVLDELAVATRWGLHRTPHPGRASDRVDREVADRLRVGWSLSRRYGVAWSALIDATGRELDDRVRVAADRAAEVAGPRFSGFVLAALPGLGLLLGHGMGADPVGVLFGTAPGRLLLLVGTALTCSGLLWSARIVGT